MEPERGSETTACTVRRAIWPQDEETARDLLHSYFKWLASNPAVPAFIRRKDRERELSSLQTTYAGEGSALFLACDNDRLCGCASVSLIAQLPRAAELKRLFVLPAARGSGTGRALIRACAAWSTEKGATELLLDTLPAAMPEAVRLYNAAGFHLTEPYNGNDPASFAFYRMALGNRETDRRS